VTDPLVSKDIGDMEGLSVYGNPTGWSLTEGDSFVLGVKERSVIEAGRQRQRLRGFVGDPDSDE
jgi:hypothetical protein